VSSAGHLWLWIGRSQGILETVSRAAPFSARPLDPMLVSEAIAFARSVGVPGIYVQNHLLAHPRLAGPSEILALHGEAELLGLVYCGDRGNLIVLARDHLDPDAVAGTVRGSGLQWRIVLGPRDIVRSLAALGTMPLVHRTQVYYAVEPSAVPPDRLRDDVRPAQRQDVTALVEATLHLNETDLGVEAWRVNKDWVKKNVKQRMREGSTLVIGTPGRLDAKLDIGSKGPAGLILEGVYTWPGVRGRGLASGLVATVAGTAGDCPLVCLHVAEDNEAARRAYENAGMREAGRCQLLLVT